MDSVFSIYDAGFFFIQSVTSLRRDFVSRSTRDSGTSYTSCGQEVPHLTVQSITYKRSFSRGLY